jgi:hypothetical protein
MQTPTNITHKNKYILFEAKNDQHDYEWLWRSINYRIRATTFELFTLGLPFRSQAFNPLFDGSCVIAECLLLCFYFCIFINMSFCVFFFAFSSLCAFVFLLEV